MTDIVTPKQDKAFGRNEIVADLKLFSPLSIRDVSLRNRIVVPPMHQYSAVKGFRPTGI